MGVGFPELFIVISLASLVFTVAMIVDAIGNAKMTTSIKVLWIIGMIVVSPLAAIVYFFVARSSVIK